jgi:hypothetical protein
MGSPHRGLAPPALGCCAWPRFVLLDGGASDGLARWHAWAEPAECHQQDSKSPPQRTDDVAEGERSPPPNGIRHDAPPLLDPNALRSAAADQQSSVWISRYRWRPSRRARRCSRSGRGSGVRAGNAAAGLDRPREAAAARDAGERASRRADVSEPTCRAAELARPAAVADTRATTQQLASPADPEGSAGAAPTSSSAQHAISARRSRANQGPRRCIRSKVATPERRARARSAARRLGLNQAACREPSGGIEPIKRRRCPRTCVRGRGARTRS